MATRRYMSFSIIFVANPFCTIANKNKNCYFVIVKLYGSNFKHVFGGIHTYIAEYALLVWLKQK